MGEVEEGAGEQEFEQQDEEQVVKRRITVRREQAGRMPNKKLIFALQ